MRGGFEAVGICYLVSVKRERERESKRKIITSSNNSKHFFFHL